MARSCLGLLMLLVAPAPLASAAGLQLGANPIRKVVKMLETMQKKVSNEAKVADEIFEKYMCYCKQGKTAIAKDVLDNAAKREWLSPHGDLLTSKQGITMKELLEKKQERAASERAMDQASAIREKEHGEFEKELGEGESYNKALDEAIQALEKGVAGSFLQTTAGGLLHRFFDKKPEFEADHPTLLAFLSAEQGTEYSPEDSREVIGIMKEMKFELDKLVTAERAREKAYADLMMTKNREVATLNKAIEERQERLGRLGVEIASVEKDKEDSEESHEEDQTFEVDLKENCKSRSATYELEKKSRSQEIIAIAETIKILNDDDALKLFKKTLPDGSESFLQLQMTTSAMRAQAKEVLARARSQVRPGRNAQGIDFITLALTGRAKGLEKVIALIDKFIANLKQEQTDDDTKKAYCERKFDSTESKKNNLDRSISDLGTAKDETKESISGLGDEIEGLKASIKSLDRSVADATAQRKEENKDFKELKSNNAKAKALLLFARQRLEKFYNPEAIAQAHNEAAGIALVQTEDDSSDEVHPTAQQAYMKASTQRSKNVLGMLDILAKSIDDEVAQATADEEAAQKEYERIMAQSSKKRAQDSKSVADKDGSRADLQNVLDTTRSEAKSSKKEVLSVAQYLSSLHSECDLLLQYFDVRKQAREDEVDALEKAKEVLSGVDGASLMQLSSVRFRKVQRLSSVL